MKFFKDLVYTRGNKNLDLSRVSTLITLICYLGMCVKWTLDGYFNPVEFGAGFTAIAGGGAAWIYHRQKMEINNAELDNRFEREGQAITGSGAGCSCSSHCPCRNGK